MVITDVEMEDPLKTQMTSFLHSHANMPDISALDQKIFDIVEQINEWKLRRDFYVRFADSPQEFIQKWLISQSNDLKVCYLSWKCFIYICILFQVI